MKNKIIALVFCMLLVAVPALTFAAVAVPAGVGGGLPQTNIVKILGAILSWGMGILLVLGILAFLFAGILYVTAAGNNERIDMAKKVMLFAIVGVIVGLLGYVMVNLVQQWLGGAAGL